MSFWSWLFGTPNHADVQPNGNVSPPSTVGGPGYSPGDPDGVVFEGEAVEHRALPRVLPSPWSGWPAEWNVPNWDMHSRFNELVDVAWNCLDLNSSVLSTMPPYRTQSGEIVEATTWMRNPDPTIYSSWAEFAKQLFWDYQLGEAFVLPVVTGANGYPLSFRVIPPWMVEVNMAGGMRRYRLGGPTGPDVTGEILHIRYKSTTDSAHGVGPLESAGGRMLTAGVLAKYVREVVQTGGVPTYTIETDQELEPDEAQDLLNQWVTSRQQNLGAPPVLDNNAQLKTHMAMTPKDMAMLEIAQFTEARIANLLGVPPFLVGLPSGGDSMTYSNVSQIFDFHDRASLRPKASTVTAALSQWALPSTQHLELNRDEYTRPSFDQRADAWVKLKQAELITAEDFQAAERFSGRRPTAALTGGEQ